MPAGTHELTGISSRYECRIKVEYHKDIMGLIEEGMLVAIRNFKSNAKDQRHSLMVISRVWPEHYGLKGLSEHSYYPMQFEIIQQSVKDWDTSDKSTMIVQISALPINYDLVLNGESEPKYEKGFTYPVIAAEAEILNRDMISHMYNQRILASSASTPKQPPAMPTKTPESGRFRCSSRWTRRSPSTSTSKQWSDTTSESSPLLAPESPISFRTYSADYSSISPK